MTRRNNHKLVPKLWGSECWIVNNDDYCGKILHLMPGFESSLHFHNVKHETMLCLWGRIEVEAADGVLSKRHLHKLVNHVLLPGDSIELPSGRTHRFQAVGGDAMMAEFSTHHENADVQRLCNSRTTLKLYDPTYSRNPVQEGFLMFNNSPYPMEPPSSTGTPTLKWTILLVLTGCLLAGLGWALGNLLFR